MRKLFHLFLCTLLIQNTYSQIIINEVQSINSTTYADKSGNYSDWIELKNITNQTIDLTNYFLSDKLENPFKWQFPSVEIQPNSILTIFADSKDIYENELHTNFKISKNGEYILLSNANKVLIQKVRTPQLEKDESYAFFEPGNYSITSSPSPNSNNSSTIFPNPIFSKKSGFYNYSLSINLTSENNQTIYYSLDGSNPLTGTKNEYTLPLIINESTVVNAVCVSKTDTSEIVTNSFFINKKHSIPVVSISFDEKEFYDDKDGIYVRGENASPDWPYTGANFYESIEAKIHFEYFEDEKKVYSSNLGAKIYGGASRTFASKSLRLIAREEYGNNKINYPFFEEKENLTEFDQLVLRNGGNTFEFSLLRDPFNQRLLAEESNVDRQAYQPTAVYFNGEFHGLMNLRERLSPQYLENNRGLEKEKINFLEINGGLNTNLTDGQESILSTNYENYIVNGSNTEFKELLDYTLLHDMKSEENYNQLSSLIDVNLFIDYFCVQIYHINWDWPHNNIRFYNSNQNGWRYLYYDSDHSIGLKEDRIPTYASFNELNRVINESRSVHSTILKKALENQTFKEKFINRMADFMNSIYEPEHMITSLDEMEKNIKSDLRIHKLKYDNDYCFECNSQTMRDFILNRNTNIINHLNQEFNLIDRKINLTLNDSLGGTIKVNQIIPNEYPWKGTYFNGIPVKLTATPNQGYIFTGWSGDTVSENMSFMSVNETKINFQANFEASNNSFGLEVSEININSDQTNVNNDSGDWIELFNNSTAPIDISGWLIQDNQLYNKFIVPNETIILPKNYLVITEDLESFSVVNNVNNIDIIEGLSFGLGSERDEINIYDLNNVKRIFFEYNTNELNLQAANGFGATIQVINNKLTANCIKGTPGKPNAQCICDENLNIDGNIIVCDENDFPTLAYEGNNQNVNLEWYFNSIYQSNQLEYETSQFGNYSLLATYQNNCINQQEITLIDASQEKVVIHTECINENTSRYYIDDNLYSEADIEWYLDNELIESNVNEIYNSSEGFLSVIISNSECSIHSNLINLSKEKVIYHDVFPLPFHNELKVTNGENDIKSIRILTLFGELLMEEDTFSEINTIAKVNTSNLTSGIYLIEVVSEKGKSVTRGFKVD